jgi:hypothetical protein
MRLKIFNSLLRVLNCVQPFTTITLKEDGLLTPPGDGHYKAGTYVIIPVK